jgi:hypothetical protein
MRGKAMFTEESKGPISVPNAMASKPMRLRASLMAKGGSVSVMTQRLRAFSPSQHANPLLIHILVVCGHELQSPP